jgi:putative transposase
VLALAEALKREKPGRTAAQVRRILQVTSGWAPSDRTLQRLFERPELSVPLREQEDAGAFGRFECTRPNEMRAGDTLHGPVIAGGKSYLFAFLDDWFGSCVVGSGPNFVKVLAAFSCVR